MDNNTIIIYNNFITQRSKARKEIIKESEERESKAGNSKKVERI